MEDQVAYMNIGQAAEAIGTTRRRIRDLIRDGQLEAIRNPLDKREMLLKREDVERFAQFAKKAVA